MAQGWGPPAGGGALRPGKSYMVRLGRAGEREVLGRPNISEMCV